MGGRRFKIRALLVEIRDHTPLEDIAAAEWGVGHGRDLRRTSLNSYKSSAKVHSFRRLLSTSDSFPLCSGNPADMIAWVPQAYSHSDSEEKMEAA